MRLLVPVNGKKVTTFCQRAHHTLFSPVVVMSLHFNLTSRFVVSVICSVGLVWFGSYIHYLLYTYCAMSSGEEIRDDYDEKVVSFVPVFYCITVLFHYTSENCLDRY